MIRSQMPAMSLFSRLTQMNCFACHDRDGKGGVGPKRRPYLETRSHVDIGDEGRIPPSLEGAGRKLQSAWVTQVVQGKGAIRPHLTARMPVFPASLTKPLPGLFASADDAPDRSAEDVFGKQGDIKAGRELLDTGCVQCHAFKDEVLAGVVGVEVGNIDRRIRPQWFHDFLLNPVALKQRTRMPTFFPNGRSSNQQILDGDTERQIAAMWYYLTKIQNQPLPEKIEKGRLHNFELTPGDKTAVAANVHEEMPDHTRLLLDTRQRPALPSMPRNRSTGSTLAGPFFWTPMEPGMIALCHRLNLLVQK